MVRAREWFEASLTPGQRWTGALALLVAITVIAFGTPRTRLVAATGSPAAQSAAAPRRSVPNRIGAFPAAPIAGAVPSASPLTFPAAEAAAPSPVAEPPPAGSPPPSDQTGPCQMDTGLPVPLAATVVGLLATTQTTIATLTGRPAPVDLAALLGGLAGCPPPGR